MANSATPDLLPTNIEAIQSLWQKRKKEKKKKTELLYTSLYY